MPWANNNSDDDISSSKERSDVFVDFDELLDVDSSESSEYVDIAVEVAFFEKNLLDIFWNDLGVARWDDRPTWLALGLKYW